MNLNIPYEDGEPTRIGTLDLTGLEHSTELGPMPEFVMIPKDWLCVDHTYQRKMEGRRSAELVRKIVEEFTWAKFQPLTVVQMEDGRFLVVDGQHRATAATLHPLVEEVPCWVVPAPERKAQAKVFVGINADRNAMSALQIFKAMLAAGDPDALQVKSVCERAGVTIVYSISGASKALAPAQTQAVSTIRKLIVQHGEGPVLAALQTLVGAYPDVPGQLRSQIISALTAMFVRYGDRIDRDRLVKLLWDRDCEDLLEAARKVKKLMGGSTESCLVEALVRIYDTKLADAKKLNPAAPGNVGAAA
ncbi:DUF6551 family protein [Azospirillum rugosum]|uniref:ParB-like nuclease domain-containing protein n=1 Tax=Azospirillum rugosum TaxID=416170 RepID=A0ABS4SEL4_9PROT|nr:DUF6551 family protein [Azospirillum rugosum]MBP2291018.1 hypothetical protein [Azospirillum rugosum]MDQ0524918.1 hypothetical protein [Azospirillum rugosum]